MSKTSLIENQWVDIVIPPPPDSQALMWWLITVVLLLGLAIGVNLIWRRQPRQRLKRNINALLRDSSVTSDPKHKLHQLEKALCQHYRAAQLSQINLDNTDWPELKHELQQACYQAQRIDELYAIGLIKQAQTIFLEANS